MPSLPNLKMSRTADDSKAIKTVKGGAIVLAGSGMCNGGRILHHFRNHLADKRTRVLFTGYQSPGSLGRRIIDGASDVRIHGRSYEVNAQVATVGGFSAHGDSDDLARWYMAMENTPPLYLVHGDHNAGELLAEELEDKAGAQVTLAETGMVVDLAAL